MNESIKHYRIYWHKRLKKFMVNIRFKGENVHIGYYSNLSDAIIARNEALSKLYVTEGLAKSFAKRPSKSKKLNRFEQLLQEEVDEKRLTEKDAKLVKEANEEGKDLLDFIK